MNEDDASLWQDQARRDLHLVKDGSEGLSDIIDVPQGKIAAFSLAIAVGIICAIEKNTDYPEARKWLEKVRRYCEINRSDLIGISVRRFGGKRQAREALEAMVFLMSSAALIQGNTLLYNAAGSVTDVLDAKYSRKKWLNQAICALVHNILDKPNFFVGKKYGL